MEIDEKINRVCDISMEIADRVDFEGIAPADLPEPDRSVYFVSDIHGVTINAGLQAWVYYHGQDENQREVVVAAQVFRSLGLLRQAEAIERLLQIYRENKCAFPDDFDSREYSDPIWDCEEEIFDALINHMGGLTQTGD